MGMFGLLAGILAEKFDQLASFQNFLIMPLTFLSGVFYSIHSLPPFWRALSQANPVFYMIDGFRYGWHVIPIDLEHLLRNHTLRRGHKTRRISFRLIDGHIADIDLIGRLHIHGRGHGGSVVTQIYGLHRPLDRVGVCGRRVGGSEVNPDSPVIPRHRIKPFPSLFFYSVVLISQL